MERVNDSYHPLAVHRRLALAPATSYVHKYHLHPCSFPPRGPKLEMVVVYCEALIGSSITSPLSLGTGTTCEVGRAPSRLVLVPPDHPELKRVAARAEPLVLFRKTAEVLRRSTGAEAEMYQTIKALKLTGFIELRPQTLYLVLALTVVEVRPTTAAFAIALQHHSSPYRMGSRGDSRIPKLPVSC